MRTASGWDLVDASEGRWTLGESTPTEFAGATTQVWWRHDVQIALTITDEDRVLADIGVAVDDQPWREGTITAPGLRQMITEAGLHGIARPARLPGLWRVEPALADNPADPDPSARVVTRPTDNPTWRFTDDHAPVPVAPPLPRVPGTTRADLLTYVVDGHTDLKPWAQVVIAGTRSTTRPFDEALTRLADADLAVYRRALVASVGTPPRATKTGTTTNTRAKGGAFDVDRAREALVRLAEGDPALPVNALGERIEIPDPDQPAAPGAPPRTVRGIVTETTATSPDLPGMMRVRVVRDVPGTAGATHAEYLVPIDASLAVLATALRPTEQQPQTAQAVIRTAPHTQPSNQDTPATVGLPAVAGTLFDPTVLLTTTQPDHPAPAPAAREPAEPTETSVATAQPRPQPRTVRPVMTVDLPEDPAVAAPATTPKQPAPPPERETSPPVETTPADPKREGTTAAGTKRNRPDTIDHQWDRLIERAAEHGYGVVHALDATQSHVDWDNEQIIVTGSTPLIQVIELAGLLGEIRHATTTPPPEPDPSATASTESSPPEPVIPAQRTRPPMPADTLFPRLWADMGWSTPPADTTTDGHPARDTKTGPAEEPHQAGTEQTYRRQRPELSSPRTATASSAMAQPANIAPPAWMRTLGIGRRSGR